MSDFTLTKLAEVAFFASMLLVGVWMQMGGRSIWVRVIGALLTVVAFGLGIVSVVGLIDQLVPRR